MTHDGRNEGMTHEGDQAVQSIFRALGVRRCETATLQSGSLAPSTSKRTISWFVFESGSVFGRLVVEYSVSKYKALKLRIVSVITN